MIYRIRIVAKASAQTRRMIWNCRSVWIRLFLELFNPLKIWSVDFPTEKIRRKFSGNKISLFCICCEITEAAVVTSQLEEIEMNIQYDWTKLTPPRNSLEVIEYFSRLVVSLHFSYLKPNLTYSVYLELIALIPYNLTSTCWSTMRVHPWLILK